MSKLSNTQNFPIIIQLNYATLIKFRGDVLSPDTNNSSHKKELFDVHYLGVKILAKPTKKIQARRAHKKTDEYLPEYEYLAMKEGPKVKKWSIHDIKAIKPLTETQREMFESYMCGNHVVAVGSAGVGKTFSALYLGLNSILDRDSEQDKVIIIRSIVTTGKDLGALPGEISEKLAPFESPYIDIVNELMGKASSYKDMKDAGKLTFMPTTFIRGLTLDNAVIIVDEIQNLSIEELISVCTRVGKNSKLILCGDSKQQDMSYSKANPQSGFDKFMLVADSMEEFDVLYFTRRDIVRSKFVKSFICACEDAGVM